MTDEQIRALKHDIRLRDDMKCVECGLTHDEHVVRHGKTLEIHRLTPGSVYSMDGCVTLCKDCHGSKPRLPRGTLPKKLGKVVLIPAVWCEVLEELAAVEQNNLTDQVKAAVKEYLARLDRLPKPKPPKTVR